MSQMSDMIRMKFKEGDDIRDAGLTTPEDIERFDDIQYGDDPKWNVMDVYRPKNSAGRKLPVIVSVHGGGWVYGDKERYQYYCMSLAQHGFAVVNFTYRLAPDFKFPAPLEDLNNVITWIFANQEEYLLDTAHIFAAGDSAGAHQLGLYAAICTNPRYAAEYYEKYGFKAKEGFVPGALALNCGQYTMNLNHASDMTKQLMADYLPEGGSKEEQIRISVTEHITENYPPVFYMTCTGDFLAPQAPLLGAKLIEKQIPHEFHFYGNAEKQLGHVFHCNMKLKEAAICNKEECDFFKKFL